MVATWSEEELSDLKALAASAGWRASDQAAKAVASLRWIDERVETVKGTPKLTGVRWQDFPWDEWFVRLATAEKSLKLLTLIGDMEWKRP
jgi:hypothetical protein